MQKTLCSPFSMIFILVAGISFGFPAKAYLSVQESNEISPVGKYKLGLEPQIKTSGGSGANFAGFADTAISDEMSIRAQIGAGDTDFFAGGSIKWVPYPDYHSQPAIGAKASVIYSRKSNDNFFTYRIDPLVSKKFVTDVGTFIPYGAIPVMLTTGNGESTTGIQIAGGTEYLTPNADNLTFGAEVGINAKDSFSYISGFVTMYIDEVKPLRKKK